MMKYEPHLHLSLGEARNDLGHRGVSNVHVEEVANTWVEGITVLYNPRLAPLLEAAE